jgi:hypothetical protein
MTPPNAYVGAAIAAMQMAKTEADLIEWWKAEQPSRAKWRLSPTQHPGLKLKEAFDRKRTELKGKQNGTLPGF